MFSDVFRICGSLDARSSGFQGPGFIVVLHDTSGAKLCGKAQAPWGDSASSARGAELAGMQVYTCFHRCLQWAEPFTATGAEAERSNSVWVCHDGAKLGYRELGVLIDVVK